MMSFRCPVRDVSLAAAQGAAAPHLETFVRPGGPVSGLPGLLAVVETLPRRRAVETSHLVKIQHSCDESLAAGQKELDTGVQETD